MMLTLRRLCFVAVLTLTLAPSIYGQASPPTQGNTPVAGAVLLSVGGEVERPLKLTASDLAKLPRRVVNAKDHDCSGGE